MAASTAVARRYAEALFAAARDANLVDAVESDLAGINDLLRTSPRVLDVLRNPLLPAERKQQIINELLSDAVQPTTLRFLHLLVEKRRSEVLPDIQDLFLGMANEYRGILPAFVTSAVPLAPAEQEALTARLQAMTGKQIQLHLEERPDLIGGMRVRIGDTVIDGTVVGYLRQLREKMKQALV